MNRAKTLYRRRLLSFPKIVLTFCLLLFLAFTLALLSPATASEVSGGHFKILTLDRQEALSLGLEVLEIKDSSSPQPGNISVSGNYKGKSEADPGTQILYSVRISGSSLSTTDSIKLEPPITGCTECTYPKCRTWWTKFFEKPCYSKYKNGYTNFGASEIYRNRCRIGGTSEFSVRGLIINITSSKLDYAMSQKVWDEMRNRHDEFANQIAQKVWDSYDPDIPDSKRQCEELKKTLAESIGCRNMTLKSIGDLKKQIDVVSRPSAFNTGYYNEAQNNTLGNDPTWTKKNLIIINYASGGAPSLKKLYNKDIWVKSLNKQIQRQTVNLQIIDSEIAKVKREIQQRGCK